MDNQTFKNLLESLTNNINVQVENKIQAQRLLKSVRIIAWYNYVIKSGVELSSIRLRPRGTTARDTYRRWNHWKNGNGKLEEDDLTVTENKVSGSRIIFETGPNGAPLWSALDNSTNPYQEIRHYDYKYECFEKDNIDSESRFDKNFTDCKTDIIIDMENTSFKESSYWHTLTRAILEYRQYLKIEYHSLLNDDEILFGFYKSKLLNKSKIDLLSILKEIKEESLNNQIPYEQIIEILHRLYLNPSQLYKNV